MELEERGIGKRKKLIDLSIEDCLIDDQETPNKKKKSVELEDDEEEIQTN